MRGFLGLLMLLPLLFVFGLALALSMLPFALAIGMVGGCVQKGGLWRLLGVLASFVMGGICIRLGYWFGKKVSIEPMLLFLYPEVRFPFLEWIFPIMFPILGWIDMIGGGLIALIGTYSSLFVKKE